MKSTFRNQVAVDFFTLFVAIVEVVLLHFFFAEVQWLCVLEHYEVSKVHESQLDSDGRFNAQTPH